MQRKSSNPVYISRPIKLDRVPDRPGPPGSPGARPGGGKLFGEAAMMSGSAECPPPLPLKQRRRRRRRCGGGGLQFIPACSLYQRLIAFSSSFCNDSFQMLQQHLHFTFVYLHSAFAVRIASRQSCCASAERGERKRFALIMHVRHRRIALA